MPQWAIENKNWNASGIKSSAKLALYVSWGFTIVWNLISFTPFLAEKSILNEFDRNPSVALIFLFPLVGIGMFAYSIKITRQWRRFGPTPLVLDPYPGSIGGQLGGYIDTRLAYDKDLRCEVNVSCRKSYISGSGKNRSRKESVKWQSEGFCHVERGRYGSRFNFRFDIPEDLPESQEKSSSTYFLWKASIHVSIDGPDFEREFEIPVFKTHENSSIATSSENHPLTHDIAENGINSIAHITAIPNGVEAYFPALQRPSVGIATLMFGVIFGGAGLFAGHLGAPMTFPVVFTPIGLGILLAGVFYLAKALQTQVTSNGVRARRFLFGYPVTTREISKDQIKTIEIKDGASMQTGNKTTIIYKVVAKDQNDKKVVLGERLNKRAEAERLLDMYNTYLGL